MNQEIRAMKNELVAMRRDFHRYPEVGWTEMRTTSIIARRLYDLDFDEILMGEEVCSRSARMGVPSEETLKACYARALQEEGTDPEFLKRTKDGMTGVIGVLRCGEGPTVAMRFDIDALPIEETEDKSHFPNEEGFHSKHQGIMHACGHDNHITVGLGTAACLARHRDELHGTVKLIFQPAEEGVRGARSVVENGHLDDVDFLFGSHISSMEMDPGESEKGKVFDGSAENGGGHSTGVIGLGAWTSLATTKLDADFTGTPAHAGKEPEAGDNAMLAAATAVLNLQAIPRFGGAMTRINVGKMVAGTSRNIICDHAHLEMEVRGSTTEANTYMETYARRILTSAAAMHNCKVEIEVEGTASAGKNDPDLVERVRAILKENTDLKVQPLDPNRKLVSEDYACLAEAVQSHGGKSVYFLNMVPAVASLHSDHFSPDEVGLLNGVEAFTAIVKGLLS
ncbi:MAG: amidohydrolase [Lachnospiraceae bacterium]|nr:amidohydrolase [Lachnospiraceae bacterium]